MQILLISLLHHCFIHLFHEFVEDRDSKYRLSRRSLKEFLLLLQERERNPVATSTQSPPSPLPSPLPVSKVHIQRDESFPE